MKSRLLSICLFILVTTHSVSADNTPDLPESLANKSIQSLFGKWIVRSVERDGDPNAAQIGQQVADVITIKLTRDRLELG